MQVVYEAQAVLVLSQPVSHCASLGLRESSWSGEGIGSALLPILVWPARLSEVDVIVSVEIDSSQGHVTLLIVNVGVLSLRNQDAGLSIPLVYVESSIHVDVWDEVVLILLEKGNY